MSRGTPTDHEFHHEQVLSLLKKAQGKTRTLASFAKDSGVNYAYLCKYMKGNMKRPLSPDTLLKLANAAEEGVTSEELLDASGFDPRKYIPSFSDEFGADDDDIIDASEDPKFNQFLSYMEGSFPHRFYIAGSDRMSREQSEREIRLFRENAVKAVYRYVNSKLSDYDVLIVDRSIPADLVLLTGLPDNSTWSFHYFFCKGFVSSRDVRSRAIQLISRLVVSSVKPSGTYFLVTNSKECFDYLATLSFPLLYQRITLLHFDPATLTIDYSEDIVTAKPQ